MQGEETEKFLELLPKVLKRVLPLGILALVIAFLFIVIFVPESEKVSILLIVIFGISIAFGLYAKWYGDKLLRTKI